MQWVAGVRIRHAQELLERTTEGVENIARRVGFDSPANFRDQFKKTTGVPPQAYRATFHDQAATAVPSSPSTAAARLGRGSRRPIGSGREHLQTGECGLHHNGIDMCSHDCDPAPK
jgi:hypothetical protein